MSQLPVVPENPRDTHSWTAYIAALNPGKATLKDATADERREWNRKVRTYGLSPIVKRHVARTAGATVIQFPVRDGRPRERRAQAARSSARSGDSGEDGEPAPADWHWRQPGSWAGLIASVRSRDFERELHLERWTGRRA